MDPIPNWWIDETPPRRGDVEPDPFAWKVWVEHWQSRYGKIAARSARLARFLERYTTRPIPDRNVKPFGIEFVFTPTTTKHPREDTTKVYPTSYRPWDKVPPLRSQSYRKTRQNYRR